ncbi:hypothetical protein [Chitinimonas lacunae]|uniref:Uncharacterized protein n=1 Tax=Chitinimonas lacunae TaxID=1963018 RepID=A0ABV8MK16_9NEIS
MSQVPLEPVQLAGADLHQETAVDSQSPASVRINQLLALLSEITSDDFRAIEMWQLGKLHSKLFFLSELAWVELDFRQEMDRINRNSNEGN